MVENSVTKLKELDKKDISTTIGQNITFRGTEFTKFTAQLQLSNVTVKIYASNMARPGSSGWVDLTNFFTRNATITSTSMIYQTTDIEQLWWKITFIGSAVNNAIKIHLLQYNRKGAK